MRALLLAVLWACASSASFAAPHFPELTGHVVDAAHVLSAQGQALLEQQLDDYERGTTNQLAVVTIPSLEGYDIADYGYQLGRHWQLGQKGKDNGAILLVAPQERAVRIEVGYGLEPVLTDALSSQIIQQIILPAFRDNHMEQGIINGTGAMLAAIGGKGIPAQASPDSSTPVVLIIFFIILFFLMRRRGSFWFLPFLPFIFPDSDRRGGRDSDGGFSGGAGGDFGSGFRDGGDGGDSGGGFSGGGGGFGGGGATGKW